MVDFNYASGRSAGRFHADYNAAVWPQLIIWDADQMSWDDKLGPSVAKSCSTTWVDLETVFERPKNYVKIYSHNRRKHLKSTSFDRKTAFESYLDFQKAQN